MPYHNRLPLIMHPPEERGEDKKVFVQNDVQYHDQVAASLALPVMTDPLAFSFLHAPCQGRAAGEYRHNVLFNIIRIIQTSLEECCISYFKQLFEMPLAVIILLI